MKIKTLLIITLASLAMLSCHHGPKPQRVKTNLPISMSKPTKGDKAIYGLACMGCSDTAVVLLPNGGGDPIRYNILDATPCIEVPQDIPQGYRPPPSYSPSRSLLSEPRSFVSA